MRIVSGKYRHRLIEWPKTLKTRPTKDCVRESIFNAIRNDVIGEVVLDLFAGSGSMGIEALSIGARKAVFVDSDKVAIETIKKNIKTLEIDSAITLFKDYHSAIDDFINNSERFGLIFIDPPYAFQEYDCLIKKLIDDHVLEEHGIIVLETDHELFFNKISFSKVKTYKYGKTFVTIMRR